LYSTPIHSRVISNLAAWSPLLLVAIADWLFYDERLGWTLGLFGACALTAVLLDARPARTDTATLGLAGATLLFALALIHQPGPLVGLMAVASLLATVVNAQLGWTSDSLRWGRRMRQFLRFGGLEFGAYALGWLGSVPRRVASLGGGWSRALDRWMLPAALTAVFVLLFALANPVVEAWWDVVWGTFEFLWRWIPDIDALRVFFWMGVAIAVWPLVRTRCIDAEALESETLNDFFPASDFVLRCLLLFNATFAVQTGLDLVYLWGGAALPEGMTYAEYAHRGAYPLVATALLAGAFVLLCFRPGGPAESDPRARKLVVAWIAQNLLLLVSTAWRLLLYIEAYGLTRLRIATILWIALVAIGLVTICWRIQVGRSNRWLLGFNVSALLAVLSVSSWIDFDSRIAWHNVRIAREAGGSGPSLDLYYLRTLGPESLPALRWFEDQVRKPPKPFPSVTRDLARELHRDLRDWRSWTLVRQQVANRLPSDWLREKRTQQLNRRRR
jgi:hypothetical protein